MQTLIQKIIQIGTSEKSISEMLQEMCHCIKSNWAEASLIGVEISCNNLHYFSSPFKSSKNYQKRNIVSQNIIIGEICIYYKSFIETHSLFTDDLIQITALLNGFIAEKKLTTISRDYKERLKELQSITQTSHIFKQQKSLSEKLQEICNFIPEAMQYPEFTVAQILFDGIVFQTNNFQKTEWVLKNTFKTPDNKSGKIEIFYTKDFPKEFKGPFLKEEFDLISNLSTLILGTISELSFQKLLYNNNERLKELEGINHTRDIINQGKPIEETLQIICNTIPDSWQYPTYTSAKITFNGKTFESADFKETKWTMTENFVTFDNNTGTIEIFYHKQFPDSDEGPFLREERNLIINIASLIRGYINDSKGRLISNYPTTKFLDNKKTDIYRQALDNSKQPLQNFLNKQTIDKYIYLDMMKYKVKEILFVATLYDAYNLEKDDSFFEKFMGPIYQYSLFSLPRIIAVSSHEQALDLLENTHFDLVIIMVSADVQDPIKLSEKMRVISHDIPIYLLLNQRSNTAYFENLVTKTPLFDKLFVWNGDSQIFFAMVKSLEDLANVENDTKIGLVRAILLVEDSSQYYSKYLPIIYSVFFDQVGEQIVDYEMNELEKISRMRSRPKLLWARNYEQANFLFNKYKDFITCVISDAEFEKGGIVDKNAGVSFLDHVRSYDVNLPILIQSSEIRYGVYAKKIKATFVNKKSELLLNKIKRFVMHNFGYGDFIFRNGEGEPIGTAKNLREFETMLHKIPDDSLRYHAEQNQFSIWLMGRGEIDLATKLNPVRLSDFMNIDDMRKKNVEIFEEHKLTKKRGKILSFEETVEINEKSIVSLSSGSLGGKGRGLAFINSLINNLDFNPFENKMTICTPKTAVIGTDEFEKFIKRNFNTTDLFAKDVTYDSIKKMFVKAHLSDDLRKKLITLLEQIKKPIAVRSSSIFEDSATQPLAGIFNTYIISNHQNTIEKRLHDLETCIKLIYASVFGDQVKAFYRNTNHKVEEEKMAVVLQELVGNYYDSYFYPHISGVAQSYNFYPVSHMKPEEGFAVCAVGLGFYIVDGGKSFRFSPKYPKVDMLTTKDQISSSQLQFLAVDFNKTNIDYIKNGERAALSTLSIHEAVNHKTLTHCASNYNFQNDRIEPGISGNGPIVVNFANILKHEYTPLPEIISLVLDTVQDAMGTPVEIEFAVDLNPEKGLPSFYLLQIKPLTGSLLTDNIIPEEILQSPKILHTFSSMGNGLVEDMYDVVFVDPKKFDKMRTLEMVKEIEAINKEMVETNKKYILIGPGRWGTSDRFLGIPVMWTQISNAKVIVEISLSNFPLDASLGSHFFHNISSMNVGYFAIEHENSTNFVHWDILNNQTIIKETTFFKHIRFVNPLIVFMNGKNREATIYNRIPE